MDTESLKYLKANISKKPFKVDRLFVTAFLLSNDIQIDNKNFLQNFVIPQSNKIEFGKVQAFLEVLKAEVKNFGFEKLIELFEYVVSPSDRIVTGAVYTPKAIREFIVSKAIRTNKDLKNIQIADIACGCGGFLYSAAIRFHKKTGKPFRQIFVENLFGLDIKSYSTTRTKILLALLAASFGEGVEGKDFNIYTGDALNFSWRDVHPGHCSFNAIVGNPPYVCSRNIGSSTRKFLKNWEVCSTGHPDLYIPFFQIGIESLKKGGVLGFITMNTFFKSVNGRALRQYFQKKALTFRIIDFGNVQIFQSRNTYTCVCLIENRESKDIKYGHCTTPQQLRSFGNFTSIGYSDLDSHKGWNLKHNRIISSIESTGIPFGDLYKTRNGIATLKNDIYIFQPLQEDKDYYYLQNGSVFQIEKEICKEIVNSNKLVSEHNLSHIKEKIIFPYEYKDGIPTLVPESKLKREYPKAYKYLVAKRSVLAERDKGKGNYKSWFAFGRNQSLDKMKHKLFFPHISDKIPNYAINSDDALLFYNGVAVIGASRKELIFLKKLMQSRLFWYYITTSSKPYSSSYFSLARNYIKNFGVCQLEPDEIEFVVNQENRDELDRFFEEKYAIRPI